MLSISPPINSAAAVRYYVDLTNEDYMTQGGEPMGIWFGKGAEKLKRSGKVIPEDFKSLMDGFSADRAQALVQNAGLPDRQRGWDLTFSASKSVSAFWSQSDAMVREQIEQAKLAGVLAALDYLERKAMWTRRGHAGRSREQVGMCAAIFQHGTSRAGDPALHTHVCVASVCVRDDGTTGSILSKPLFIHKMAAGAIFRAVFAAELIKRLGLVLVQKGMQPFEIEGVPGSLTRTFSKRREQIERVLKERGESGPEAARRATLSSRPPKQHYVRTDLFRDWEGVGRELQWSTQQARALLGRQTPPTGSIPKRDVVTAIKHLSLYQAHFTERDLVRAVADQVQRKGYGLASIETAVRDVLPKLVNLGQLFGEPQFTTKGMLRTEKKLLTRVIEGADSTRHVVSGSNVARVLASRQLSTEQKLAIQHITTTPGRVKVVSGLAGTGKSTMLSVAREIWEKSSFSVVGASLTGKAAESLTQSARIKSYTVASLLGHIDQPLFSVLGVPVAATSTPMAPKAPAWSPFHGVRLPHLRFGMDGNRIVPAPESRPIVSLAGASISASSTKVAGLRLPHLEFSLSPRAAEKIGPKTIVVVDEAGLIGTRQMADLVDRLTAARAKIVLVGDRRQNPPIEAGAPFQSLATRIGHATLTEIQRQYEPWARQMVKDLSSGEVRKAIDELHARGRIHIAKDRQETITQLVDDWRKAGHPRENLILASTREDVHALNQAAQAKRASLGELIGRPVEHRNQKFHVGDRVIFDKNSTKLGVNNGTLGLIVNARGEDLVVRLDSGIRVTVPLDRYPHVSLGYALTGHRAQGLTCENSFSLISSDFAGREMAYVHASRARAEAHLYLDDKTAGKSLTGLENLLRPGRAKLMALDILEDSIRDQSGLPGQEASANRPGENADTTKNRNDQWHAGEERREKRVAQEPEPKANQEEAKRVEELKKQREEYQRRQERLRTELQERERQQRERARTQSQSR